MDRFLAAPIEAAKQGLPEGRGQNRRAQEESAIPPAGMDCLENAGRQRPEAYRRGAIDTTLSPCDMSSGAILLFQIPRVGTGEDRTFRGPEERLRARGVELVVPDDADWVRMMERFRRENAALWNEDTGEI